MIGSISDLLIMVVVAILLLGGEKDLSGTVKTWAELFLNSGKGRTISRMNS